MVNAGFSQEGRVSSFDFHFGSVQWKLRMKTTFLRWILCWVSRRSAIGCSTQQITDYELLGRRMLAN